MLSILGMIWLVYVVYNYGYVNGFYKAEFPNETSRTYAIFWASLGPLMTLVLRANELHKEYKWTF